MNQFFNTIFESWKKKGKVGRRKIRQNNKKRNWEKRLRRNYEEIKKEFVYIREGYGKKK